MFIAIFSNGKYRVDGEKKLVYSILLIILSIFSCCVITVQTNINSSIFLMSINLTFL